MELPRIPAADAGVWMWVGQKVAVVGKTTNVVEGWTEEVGVSFRPKVDEMERVVAGAWTK